MTTEPVLVADSIGRSFGPTRVLNSATLWAWPGRITALLGRNGCGKSTLLKIAAGRLRAHWGTVRFRGRVHDRPRLHVLAREGLMYIPEGGLLVRDRWVDEQAEVLASGSGEAVEAWAARWRVDGFLDRLADELSTGERNRVSLALTVLRRPVCLLADEPLTSAAPADRMLIRDMLLELRGEGCAVALTGHEAREILDFADRVIWLSAGTTHDLGSAGEARQHAQFLQEYLGPDFDD